MIGSWVRSILNGSPIRRVVSRPFRGYRLEELESRWNPASLLVNTLLDSVNPNDNFLSLREALQLAGQFGGGGDIGFNSALFASGPRTLTLTRGPLLFPDAQGVNLNGPGQGGLNVHGPGQGVVSVLGPGADLLTISGNDSTRIFENGSSDAAIVGVTLADARNFTSGGAVFNVGSMMILDCVIRDSEVVATTGAATGGGVANFGSLLIQNTAFVNNLADQGGGLANFGSVTVVNSTFAANRAGMNGGAIYNTGGAVLRHVTVAGNLANQDLGSFQGGGIYHSPVGSPLLTLYNSIVANNQTLVAGGGLAASDLEGATIDAASANNLIADAGTAGGLTDGVNANQIGVDPKLMGLQLVQGGTFVFKLFGDSPAIDAGDAAQSLDIFGDPLAIDQLGFDRLFGAAVDLGAFEVDTLGSTILPGVAGVNFAAGFGPVLIDPFVQLSVDSANQPLVSATIAPIDFRPADFLTIVPNGPIAISGNTVTFSGRVIASFSGGGLDPLEFQFVSDVALAEVEALLRSIAFGNFASDPAPGPRLVEFTVVDASLSAVTAVYFISVDAPVASGLPFAPPPPGFPGVPPPPPGFPGVPPPPGFPGGPLGGDPGEAGFPFPFPPPPGAGPFAPFFPGPRPETQPFGSFVFLGTSAFAHPVVHQHHATHSEHQTRQEHQHSTSRHGHADHQAAEHHGPAGHASHAAGAGGHGGPGGLIGLRGVPGSERIRPEGAQVRLPFSPQGRGDRGPQPPPEVRAEKSTFQAMSRSMFRSETLSGSVQPIFTPHSAVGSILDSDDSVTLIDELRRSLAPVVVSKPPAVPLNLALSELLVEGEALEAPESIVEEAPIPLEPMAVEAVPEEVNRSGRGLLLPLIGSLIWVPWQRWRSRGRKSLERGTRN